MFREDRIKDTQYLLFFAPNPVLIDINLLGTRCVIRYHFVCITITDHADDSSIWARIKEKTDQMILCCRINEIRIQLKLKLYPIPFFHNKDFVLKSLNGIHTEVLQ